jgi:hypothetical protein
MRLQQQGYESVETKNHVIGQQAAQKQGLSLHAVILSLLVILVYMFINLTGITGEYEPFIYFDLDTYMPTAGALMPVLIIIFVLNPIGRLAKLKYGFTKGDRLIVYTMVLFGGMTVAHGFFNWVIFSIPALPEMAMYDDRYLPYLERLSTLIMPKGEDAILGFWLGKDAVGLIGVPWNEWIMPLLLWGAFYLVLVMVGLCFATIFRKRWTEVEHMVFPISQAPLALIESEDAGGRIGSFWRNRLMWTGFAVSSVLTAITLTNKVLPWLPRLTGNDTIWFRQIKAALETTTLGLALSISGPGGVANIDPAIIGVGYFTSLDVLFSVVFFRFVFRPVVNMILINVNLWQIVGGDTMLGYQYAFSAVGLGLWQTWLLRKDLVRMIKSVFCGVSPDIDKEEGRRETISLENMNMLFSIPERLMSIIHIRLLSRMKKSCPYPITHLQQQS